MLTTGRIASAFAFVFAAACSSSTPLATIDAAQSSTPATFACGASTCTQSQLCLTRGSGVDAGVANPPVCSSRPNACDDCSCVTATNTCGIDTTFNFSCARAGDGHLDVTCPGQ